jgi:hypothetical protein
LKTYGGGLRESTILSPPRPFSEIEKLYSLHLKMPWLPVSLNKALRTNRYATHRKNLAWDSYIGLECYGKLPAKPLARARIELIRHAHRSLDYDGLVGSLKPVVDALVTARVLSDDSWKVLGAWQVDQRFRPKSDGPLLEIIVSELEN